MFCFFHYFYKMFMQSHFHRWKSYSCDFRCFEYSANIRYKNLNVKIDVFFKTSVAWLNKVSAILWYWIGNTKSKIRTSTWCCCWAEEMLCKEGKNLEVNKLNAWSKSFKGQRNQKPCWNCHIYFNTILIFLYKTLVWNFHNSVQQKTFVF